VARQATLGGAVATITRRAAASSVAPIVPTIGAPCVLASPGARDACIHQRHQEGH